MSGKGDAKASKTRVLEESGDTQDTQRMKDEKMHRSRNEDVDMTNADDDISEEEGLLRLSHQYQKSKSFSNDQSASGDEVDEDKSMSNSYYKRSIHYGSDDASEFIHENDHGSDGDENMDDTEDYHYNQRHDEEDEQEDDEDEGRDDEDEEEEINEDGAFDPFNGSGSGRISGNDIRSRLLSEMFPEAANFFSALSGGGTSGINGLIDGLSRRDDPFLILETLNELSDRLLVTNSLTEAGVPVTKLSKALISILNDPFLTGELEVQLVACRCIYNLWEVNPDYAYTLVSVGAIEAIQPKLMEISYIDLAEQCLQTLEVISRSSGKRILSTGCLSACVQYLDFFTIHAQRKALIIAANSCVGIKGDSLDSINEVFPILSRVAVEYSDTIAVENALVAICGILNSFKDSPLSLEKLVKPELLRRMLDIISASSSRKSTKGDGVSSSSTVVLNLATVNKSLTALASISSASPKISFMLINECEVGKFFNKALGRDYDAKSSSIEVLMKTSKDLFIKVLNFICSLLPVVTVDSNEEYSRFCGYFSMLTDARSKINSERKELFNSEKNSNDLNSFANHALPLLVDMHSASVDFEVRRRILLAIIRLASIANFKKISTGPQSINSITSLLTSVVIQAKNALENDFSSANINHPAKEVRKNASLYVLFLGTLIVVDLFTKKYSSIFLKEFDREGLFSNISTSHDICLKILETYNSESDNRADSKALNIESDNGNAPDDENSTKEEQGNNFEEGVYNENEGEDEDENEEEEEGNEEDDVDNENNEEEEDDDDVDVDDDDDDGDEDDDVEFAINRFGSSHYQNENNLADVDANNFSFAGHNDIAMINMIAELLSSISQDYTNAKHSSSLEMLPHIKLHKEVVTTLKNSELIKTYSYDQWLGLWKKLAQSLDSDGVVISSYELISSGIIDTLNIIFGANNTNCVGRLGSPCCDSFIHIFVRKQFVGEEVPLNLLVNKLQEGLGRVESFEILTSGSSNAGLRDSQSSTNKALSMAKQIKLRLSCDDESGSLPENYKTLMLSTHAVATFKSINNFLKNRILLFSRLTDAVFGSPTNRTSSGNERRVSSSSRRTSINSRVRDDSRSDADGDEIIDDIDEEYAAADDEIAECAIEEDNEEEDGGEDSADINPSDKWYLEFSINGEVVPLETTIYGAIYKSLQMDPNNEGTLRHVNTSNIWNTTHAIKFRRVSQPPERPADVIHEDGKYISKTGSNDLEALGDASSVQILKLLKCLFLINNSVKNNSGANDSLFLNWKLTAKLNRQLEEPLIVVSGTLPGWSVHITRQFPFIFPLNTRLFFLHSTSFGYSRLIEKWKLKNNESQSNSNTNNAIAELGRPNRHKIRISRKHILQSGIKLLELYASHSSVLEIEYFNEEGSGLGPTLEFYSVISKEFQKKSLKMWRGSLDNLTDSSYVMYQNGLFPAPMSNVMQSGAIGKKILSLFKMLGKLVGRSLLDGRLVDFAFNEVFFQIAGLIDEAGAVEYDGAIRSVLFDRLRVVDKDLASSLQYLQKFIDEYEENATLYAYPDQVKVDGATLEDLSLSFVLPGYPDFELVDGGADIPVMMSNVDDYISKVIDATVGGGVCRQIKAFIEGFSQVIPYNAVTIFTPTELIEMFGNGEEDWSFETLCSSIHANHGYNTDSESFVRLLEVMVSFDKDERRKFLQFLTGSPKLPIGGFKALRPEFTVVRKPSEDGMSADDFLPSVMTCANYLKLPEYSSKEKMRERIIQAINEGLGAFLLS
ncbi:putative ubiquitin-protein ligase [Saccharomycopsis crataegensis]|uniref:HECT-type E3 ubiquitin transferase n=1 Tax=Saccharomycopsis crataegensis TaxID=43959 RepID=A0AAV5QDH3_9ASCO|nr:putative ubiquitin-protein ligase [Saccharomycopsis crataegensis]